MTVPRESVKFCSQNGPESDCNWHANIKRECVKGPWQFVEPSKFTLMTNLASGQQNGIWFSTKINFWTQWSRAATFIIVFWNKLCYYDLRYVIVRPANTPHHVKLGWYMNRWNKKKWSGDRKCIVIWNGAKSDVFKFSLFCVRNVDHMFFRSGSLFEFKNLSYFKKHIIDISNSKQWEI